MVKPSTWLLVGLITVVACGEAAEAESKPACPVAKGDFHVADTRSKPGNIYVMLHTIGRKCAATGTNRFGLYGEKHSTDFAITSVSAVMPAMGHGPAEAPVIKTTNEFEIDFQMPGDWKIDVQFTTPATTAVQEASFSLRVK